MLFRFPQTTVNVASPSQYDDNTDPPIRARHARAEPSQLRFERQADAMHERAGEGGLVWRKEERGEGCECAQ